MSICYRNNSTTFNNGQKIYPSTRKQLELNFVSTKEAINLELVDVKLFYVNRESNKESYLIMSTILIENTQTSMLRRHFSNHTPYSGHDINLNSRFVSALTASLKIFF